MTTIVAQVRERRQTLAFKDPKVQLWGEVSTEFGWQYRVLSASWGSLTLTERWSYRG